jgi:hypothetical protein
MGVLQKNETGVTFHGRGSERYAMGKGKRSRSKGSAAFSGFEIKNS